MQTSMPQSGAQVTIADVKAALEEIKKWTEAVQDAIRDLPDPQLLSDPKQRQVVSTSVGVGRRC